MLITNSKDKSLRFYYPSYFRINSSIQWFGYEPHDFVVNLQFLYKAPRPSGERATFCSVPLSKF